jgi:TetR/AcrR family transcriptional repressor of nem operon
MRKAAVQAGPGREAGAIIDTYLGDQHCANPADGCPLAALAAELARQPRGMRLILERATQAYADGMAAFMPGRTVEQRRKQAMVLFSGMAGTLSLARAVADDTLRASILQTARTSYRRVFTADG